MRAARQTRFQAMTLVEVLVSMVVYVLLLGALIAAFMQTRRSTEESIYRATATTIATGYMEQLRTMDIAALGNGYDTGSATSVPDVSTTSYQLPTVYPQVELGAGGSLAVLDPLMTTPGTPPTSIEATPTPGALAAWLKPTGYVDNLKSFDMAKNLSDLNADMLDTTSGGVKSTTAYTTWANVWPGSTAPTTGYGTSSSTQVNPSPTTLTPGLMDLHMNVWVWITDLTDTSVAYRAKVFAITLVYTWQVRDGARIRYYRSSLRTVRSDIPTY